MLRDSPFSATFMQTLAQSQKTVAGDDLSEHKSFWFMHLPIRAQKPRKVVPVLSTFAPDFNRSIFTSLNNYIISINKLSPLKKKKTMINFYISVSVKKLEKCYNDISHNIN